MNIITISGLNIVSSMPNKLLTILRLVLFLIAVLLIFSLIHRMDTDPASYGNLPSVFTTTPVTHEGLVISVPSKDTASATASATASESSICKKISSSIVDSTIIPRIQRAKQEGRPIVWVYFEYEVSARKWLNFYSRRSPQGMPGLLQLCLMTIQRHFPSKNFEVIVYTQDDIPLILPKCHADEYLHMRTGHVEHYLSRAFARYALLHHYGGYSIPLDTIIMRQMTYSLADYQTGKCIVFGPTSSIYREWYGVDDARIAATEGHPLIKDIIQYILENSRKFHNSMEFRDAIFRRVQELVTIHAGLIRIDLCMPTVNSNGRPYLIDDLYASSWSMPQPDTPVASYCMIPIYYQQTVTKYAYGYLRQLTADDIATSELWVAEQIRRSLSSDK